MIGRGIIKVDDYVKFGEVVDKLMEVAVFVTVSRKNIDVVSVACRRADVEKLKEVAEQVGQIISLKLHGGMGYAKIKWR